MTGSLILSFHWQIVERKIKIRTKEEVLNDDIITDTRTDRQTTTRTDFYMGRRRDTRADRWAVRQTDRQTNKQRD